MLADPLPDDRLRELAATLGADVPFFLAHGPQLGTGDGSTLEPLELPQDYAVVLLLPRDVTKESTAAVYAAFDRETGFEKRCAELRRALKAGDLAAFPPNDLASSPLAPADGSRRVSRRRQRRGPGCLRPLPGHGGGQERSSGARAPRPHLDCQTIVVAFRAVTSPGTSLRQQPDQDRTLDRGRRGLAHARRRGPALGGVRPRGRCDRVLGRPPAATTSRPSRGSSPGSSPRRRRAAVLVPIVWFIAKWVAITRDCGRGDRRADLSVHRARPRRPSRSRSSRGLYSRAVGRSQAVRQRVLVPRSQVRILAPQPFDLRDRHADRSRRHGRRARNADALRGAEAPAPAARPPARRLGDPRRAGDAGADRVVVVTSPRRARRLRRARGCGAGRAARHR